MTNTSHLRIAHTNSEINVADLDADGWKNLDGIVVDRTWSGSSAPAGRSFSAKLQWSDTALYVRFDANQAEPLCAASDPLLEQKTMNLWDYDVCEIFIAPDDSNSNKYFEFEVAPTGEWIDIAIEFSDGGRNTDFDYRSGMTCAARIEDDRVVMAIRIPWEAFGRRPKVGDTWLGNLFRCVGSGPTRGYLAWQPTLTPTPNFHVPEKFGEFVFG